MGEFVNNISLTSIYGSGIEKGLEKAYQATSIGEATVSNGFLRPDAFLSIVFLSDERDQSPQNNTFYYNHFSSLKVDPSKVKLHSIIGDFPNGCQYNNRHIAFGDNYYDLSIMTGGNVYSICATDWGIQMQNLAANSAGSNLFLYLTNP